MKNGHIVFTSVNRAYLARALTLARSVHLHDPDVHFVVLLVEPKLPSDFQPGEVFHEFLAGGAFDEILTLSQLDTSTIANFESYSVIEMCTAVKGIASQFLLNREGVKIVTYLDPDLYFFTSLGAIREEHQNSDVLLTPHLNHNPTTNLVIHNDEVAGSMNHGIFNLGFVSFKSNNRSKMIASWWADRLAISSRADYGRGLFTDQKWWDLTPVYFPDIGVVKNDGWNMAPWNLSERKLISTMPPTLISGDPLVFFHFSKFPSEDFFEKTRNYSKPILLNEIISEYSLKFDQATQDVSALIAVIEKFLEKKLTAIPRRLFREKIHSKSIQKLNELLYAHPKIYSSLARNSFIKRRTKWVYRKFVSVETKANLLKYEPSDIESQIGNRLLRILITHQGGGGVEEVVKFRASQIAGSGMIPGVLRPIDRETFKLTLGDKSFQINGPEEFKSVLTLSDQIEIHHIFGFEKQLDLLGSYPIDAVYLHDRYFLSQTPFSDSLRYGELKHEIAGVNIPLNVDFKMDSANWSAKNRLILQRSKKIYAPSFFLAEQFQRAYSDLSIHQIVQEEDPEPLQIKKMSNLEALQIILISPTNFHKGSEVLLKVATLLEKESTKITFKVIGDLDFGVSRELAKLKNVELVPQMSRNRLKIKLSEIENGIGWIPSITAESYSLALSDFLSSGQMVISSELGAVAERLSRLPGHFTYDPSAKIEDLANDFLRVSLTNESNSFFQVLKPTKV
jgi:hypothetical protein